MPSTGITERFSRVDEIVAKVAVGAEEVKQESLHVIFDESQARVPVASAAEVTRGNPGDLKASGRIEDDAVKYGGGDVDYAADVEYGTSKMAAEPYLTPSADHEGHIFGSRFATRIREAMHA
jgi:hypothetical protein